MVRMPYLVTMAFAAFAAVAHADQVATYSIDFSGGDLQPTYGSFTLDETTDKFTSFDVVWDGLTFNMLDSPLSYSSTESFGTCPSLSASVIASYCLGEGTCTTPANVSWSGIWLNESFNGFNFVLGNVENGSFTVGFGFTALPTSGTPLITPENTNGTASASLVTPEPSYLAPMVLFGSLLIVVGRKRKCAS